MDDPIYDRVALCDGEGSRCATGRGRTLRRVGVALCDPALVRYVIIPGRKTTLSTLIGVVLDVKGACSPTRKGPPAFHAVWVIF